jgi:hypothetical protein
LEDLEESPQGDLDLTEAEWRLEKAGFYRAVINSQLLSSEHPAAVEVEQELQGWAKRQLETLLGIRAAEPAGGRAILTQELQFTEDESQALKLLAAKVLGKTGSAAPQNPPAVNPVPQTAAPAPVRPAAAKPAPAIRPVATKDVSEEPKGRGRGRPRKYACKVCGLMECNHKVKETKSSLPIGEASGEMYDGIPIQVAPDGTKFIDAASGIRYKLQIRTVTHRTTGQTKEAYIPVEWSKPIAKGKPYPSPQEVEQLAAQEAHSNLGKVQGSPIFQKMMDGAMAAPPKEPYIPTPSEN